MINYNETNNKGFNLSMVPRSPCASQMGRHRRRPTQCHARLFLLAHRMVARQKAPGRDSKRRSSPSRRSSSRSSGLLSKNVRIHFSRTNEKKQTKDEIRTL